MSDEQKPKRVVDLRDLIGLAGLGFFCFGAWLVYPPASFILGGGLLMVAAILTARA